MHLKNIARMHALPAQGWGMDIIIVSTENAQQEKYWESRLHAGRGWLVKADARICCVCEEWAGGAGNGLGTLHTFVKAREKILARDNIDIAESLRLGASVAIYHTAGMGKRLFPLAGSEYCNKAAVKLPSLIGRRFLSVLEAVIKQTGVFSNVRRGRVSIFWGDQLFIPSVPIETRSKAHIDILAIVDAFPSEETWEEKKLYNYGVMLMDGEGGAQDLEKCPYSIAKRLAAAGKKRLARGAAVSLGAFSLSAEMLFALLDEFASELAGKQAKMDCEPYIWMPLTLDEETYLEAMEGRGITQRALRDHHARMRRFRLRFLKIYGETIFGVVDVGSKAFWWDYGTLQGYVENNLKLCNSDAEAVAMRAFFNMQDPVSHSRVRLSRIHQSVVIGVAADQLRISRCILLNTDIRSFEGNGCLLYNVVEGSSQAYVKDTVRADVLVPSSGQLMKMVTSKERDGKADWETCLPGNPCSYQELFRLVHAEDPLAAEKLASIYHHAL